MGSSTRVTFDAGDVITNEALTRAFGRNMGGIRYLGSTSSRIRQAAVITVPNVGKRQSHPYRESEVGDLLLYMGEGLVGDQKMRRGNLALLLQPAQAYPLFVFRKTRPNSYLCLGAGRVVGFHETAADGADGTSRRAFVYHVQLSRSVASDAGGGEDAYVRLRSGAQWVTLRPPTRRA